MALEQGENRRALGAFQERRSSPTERNARRRRTSPSSSNLAIARMAYEIGNVRRRALPLQQDPVRELPAPARRLRDRVDLHAEAATGTAPIGVLHSLHSPYYDDWFWPELYVLEANAYLGRPATSTRRRRPSSRSATRSPTLQRSGPPTGHREHGVGPIEYVGPPSRGVLRRVSAPRMPSRLPLEAVRAVRLRHRLRQPDGAHPASSKSERNLPRAVRPTATG